MHFNVIVVGNDVEGQMARFQENNNGDCPEEYMVFHAAGKDGTEDEFESEEEAQEEFGSNLDRDNSYWFNPNSRWDWFVVGGRWGGFFKLKSDAKLLPGVEVDSESPDGYRYVDRCHIGDIDFEGMREDARQEAERRYDRYVELTTGLPEVLSFEHFKSICASVYEARDQYSAQPAIQALNSEQLLPWNRSIAEEFGIGREAVAAKAAGNVCVPYAILMNGEWLEQGVDGLLGKGDAEMTEEQWAIAVHGVLAKLPPTAIVTMVDYHC